MSVEIQTVVFEQREAHLSDLSGGAPWTVHGVALGADDVTVGQSGIKKLWPAEELETAAKSLEGRDLVEDHNNKSRGVVGRVTKAGYKEGVGVIYEAELFDEDLAEKIDNGLLEVSIRGKHIDVAEMEETEDGAKIVEDIVFDNLSIVPTGAAPSNTIEIGETEELSVAELAAFTSQLAEIEPGMWVTDGDMHGITISAVEDGEIEVDIYEEMDGMWRSTGETTMVSVGSLEEWDVDEDDIGQMEDEEDEEENEKESSNSPIDIPSKFMFESEDDAMKFIEDEDGLTGVHQMEGLYVPGDTHEEFLEWWDNQSANSKHKDDEEEDEMEENLVAEDDKIQWDDDDGLTRGVVVDRQQSGCFEEELDADRRVCAEENDPVLLINKVRKNNSNKWKKTGEMMARLESEVEETDFSMLAAHPEEDGGTPEYEEGDMVRWQVEPQLFGEIVHVDEKRDIVMVEIYESSDGMMESTGFTISAGFSDLNPMEKPKDELEKVEGEERQINSIADKKELRRQSPERFIDDEVEELQAIHEPEWDSAEDKEWNAPDLEDFTDESWGDLDGDEREEIANHFIVSKTGEFPPERFSDLALPVVEPDGTLNLNALANAKARAGQVETVSQEDEENITNIIDRLANENFEGASFGEDEEEAAHPGIHRPRTIDDTGEEPNVENSGPVDVSLDLINKYLRLEGKHERDSVDKMLSWIFGANDLPMETVSDFRTAANAFLNQTPGTDSFEGMTIEQFRDWLLMHGDGSQGRREQKTQERGELPPGFATPVHVLTGDDLQQSTHKSEESELDDITTKVFNMTEEIEEKLAELSEPVAVEQDDLEELQQKADRFEEMSSTLEDLKERTDILDDVDREQVEELAEAEEPVVVESARYESLEGEAEQVKKVYAAELSKEWDAFSAEELADRFSIEELREKYEDEIGDPAEELAKSEEAEPKSGDVEETEPEGEQLSEDEKEAEEMREELRSRILERN